MASPTHGSSAAKESTCNAGGPNSIPGSGRFLGEGIGYPHQYSWASLVAQLVKNLPAMWETWLLQSLGWEDSPGGGHGNPLLYSCLEDPHGQMGQDSMARAQRSGRLHGRRALRCHQGSQFVFSKIIKLENEGAYHPLLIPSTMTWPATYQPPL